MGRNAYTKCTSWMKIVNALELECPECGNTQDHKLISGLLGRIAGRAMGKGQCKCGNQDCNRLFKWKLSPIEALNRVTEKGRAAIPGSV